MSQSQTQNPLPAGLLPEDSDIELYGILNEFGKCKFMQNGIVNQPFNQLPDNYLLHLWDEFFADKRAQKALDRMGVHKDDQFEHYNFCNRAKLDFVPDIHLGKLTREYFDCGRRGRCPGEGDCCKAMAGDVKLTPRETECLKLNAKGKNYSQIATEMGFRNQLPVNSLMARLRDKLGAESKSDLIIKSIQFGIV